MFTGIVRDLGKVVVVTQRSHDSLSLKLECSLPARDLERGASVACNGVCLTVVDATCEGSRNYFDVDLGFETLQKTAFCDAKVGDTVNLEPSLRFGDALGGHMVSGHVDCRARIVAFEKIAGGFAKLCVEVEKNFALWMIPKGSICLQGVSLTIVEALPRADKIDVHVMLIPETLRQTRFGSCKIGEWIEVEFDGQVKAVASVVERMLPTYLNNH